VTSPALYVAAHPDDVTLAMGVSVAEHLRAGQDVHVLHVTRGTASGVLAALNGTSTSPNPWWGVPHDPAVEGYTPLTPEQLGDVRMAETNTALDCLLSGYTGTLTRHEANLPDGAVTPDDAYREILAVCDAIAPDAPVRLKGHTWVPQLDTHPDHIAVGAAIRQLAVDWPTAFADVRYYLLPPYWTDPDLNLVKESWDTPADAGVAARAVNAVRCHGAWGPGRFAVGFHSTYGYFATLLAGPKCLYHT
jgi:LmbE family N-acetylglucosaminyl deacetylase